MTAVAQAFGVGRRYGQIWALRHCSVAIPAGRVTAVVGPNGAGKTTFLHLFVGLVTATDGTVSVLGVPAGSPPALDRVAFVAQDAPLYRGLGVVRMLEITAKLNTTFDRSYALRRLGMLGIALNRRVGKLSGGQRAQFALTLALARHPDLLVLDEPVASLDPLARHEFLTSLADAAAGDGISVVLSSHIVTELERVADYLVLLSGGRIQMAGDIDDLLASHALVATAPAGAQAERATRPHRAPAAAPVRLVRRSELPDPTGAMSDVTLDDLVLGYLRGDLSGETQPASSGAMS